jgi:hypothetical protein
VTAGRDDDALTWGDDDPTLDVGAARDDRDPAADDGDVDRPPSLPAGYAAAGKGSDAVSEAPVAAPAETEEEAPPLGNAALISLGVLGGIYGLYAIGWIIGGLRLQGWRPFLVTDAMYQGSLWLAVLAPVLWFVTTLLLTRGARSWVRFAWLGAGAVLLLPWPFVMIGAVGQ